MFLKKYWLFEGFKEKFTIRYLTIAQQLLMQVLINKN